MSWEIEPRPLNSRADVDSFIDLISDTFEPGERELAITAYHFAMDLKGIIARRGYFYPYLISRRLDYPAGYFWSLPLNRINDFPDWPAIYFAVLSYEVVYVGQAVNLKKRWRSHPLRERLKNLGGYLIWVDTKRDCLNFTETYFIKLLEPKFNKKSKPRIRTGRYFLDEPIQAAQNLDNLLNILNSGEFDSL